MKLKSLALPLTMLGVFALTLFFTLRQQKAPEDAPPSKPARATSWWSGPSPAVRASQPDAPGLSAWSGPASPPHVAASAAAEAEPVPDNTPTKMEIPIRLIPLHGDDDSLEDVMATNLGSREVAAQIAISNPRTGKTQSVELTFAPHEKKRLAQAGVTLQAGDEVTVSGPEYGNRDIVLE